MFCKKGIYVNWGNIPSLEFDFGPVNLFSGGNGSGKTTAADGIQSLMTAAYENLFSYNPGQDESTQRSRAKQVRTLASYVLGCDDGSYARPRATDGYLAAVFHPTTGESGEAFTAVMGVRASLDKAGNQKQARQEDIIFLIVPSEELKLEHFVREYKDGKHVVPINEIANILKKEFGKKAIEVYDKKGPYLNRLYGALKGLKGSVSPREAKHAAKTFSNFMAYKPVKSINEFVANEVLEPKDLNDDIKQVSELMKTIYGMEEETRHVIGAIEILENANEAADGYIEHWMDMAVIKYAEVTRQFLIKQKEYVDIKNDQRTNQEEIKDTEVRILTNDEKKALLHTELIALEAKRQGIPALKDKDELEKEIEAKKQKIGEDAVPLLNENFQISENHRLVEDLQDKIKRCSIGLDIPAFDEKSFRRTLSALIDAGSETGIDAQKIANADWVGVTDLEFKLDGLIDIESKHRDVCSYLFDNERDAIDRSVRDQLSLLVSKRKEDQEKIHHKITQQEAEIRKLENNAVTYPPHVIQAVQAIKAQCPEADPCVLCDFIEVIDPRWQMAIEGYIGGSRFAIIVDPAYESEAIKIVRNMGGRKNNAQVIQGEKAQKDASRMNLPKDSIVELMDFDHKIVEYFIKAKYGYVVQVPDRETLRQTSRGLMAEGMGSGGYAMFRCDMDDADLVFGQGAREKALKAKQAILQDLIQQSQQIEESYRQADDIYSIVDKIKRISCADVVRNMLELFRSMQNAERQLANLDLSDFKELENELESTRNDFNVSETNAKELQEMIGKLKEKATSLEQRIDRVSKDKEKLLEEKDQEEKFVIDIAKVNVDFDSEAALEKADELAAQAKQNFNFDDQIQEHTDQLGKCDRSLYEAIMKHNQTSSDHTNIHYFTGTGESHDAEYFKHVIKIKRDVENVHNSLKNNVLVDRHGQLENLRDDFNTAFVTNLCHSIYQSINDGKRVLEDLNKELEHHRFGADQERFYFDYKWVPEFQEYQKFFKEVIEVPNLGDGSTLFDAELSEKSCAVRDKLLSMLLEKDEQTAQRQLKRISDYRNYREYEIYKEPLNKEPIALSKYGTGSGGQLETPAYIIRSAAVTSAFKFNEGNTHCRMVLVDEAFSKMDETRSREVIKYLTETLGLQLIFIMPTSKSGPFMDLISNQVVFSKCPTEKPVGELKTRVIVDRKVCNQANIEQLWANHRKAVRHQASLDFMEDFV